MTRAPRGFTLVELLVVTLLIGVLAALAVNRVSVARQRAYVGAMQADLRNLATVQEAYFADNDRAYAPRLRDLAYRFQPSSGVVVRLTNVTPRGWTATAEHSATGIACSLNVEGTAASAVTCSASGQSSK